MWPNSKETANLGNFIFCTLPWTSSERLIYVEFTSFVLGGSLLSPSPNQFFKGVPKVSVDVGKLETLIKLFLDLDFLFD